MLFILQNTHWRWKLGSTAAFGETHFTFRLCDEQIKQSIYTRKAGQIPPVMMLDNSAIQ